MAYYNGIGYIHPNTLERKQFKSRTTWREKSAALREHLQGFKQNRGKSKSAEHARINIEIYS